MPKFMFIETDYQADLCNPFFDRDSNLANTIKDSLKAVFDGNHCPHFAHVELDGTGFIAICSKEYSNDDLKKAFEAWRDARDNNEIEDTKAFEFQP